MEITRNVILDLLPMYLADEVSEDTRTLVTEYLKSDSELAEIAEKSVALDLPKDIPMPLNKEDQMEAYKEAKRYMFWRTVVLGVIVSVTIISFLAFAALAAFFLISA